MHIGSIGNNVSPKFYHANTDIPFDPEVKGDSFLWSFDKIYDTSVDIKYSFDNEYYVGSVRLNITGAKEASLLLDGARVAVHDITAPVYVNLCGKEMTIRVRGDLVALSFKGAEIYGFLPNDNDPFLLPIPKTVKYGDQALLIGNITADSPDGLFAVEFLKDSLRERSEELPCGNGIDLKFSILSEYANERYTINVSENGAEVKAGSKLALLWGACRIIDLWDDGHLRKIEIDDKPDVPMRGFHMGLPTVDRIDFVKKLARYVLLPLGYNHVILEFNGDMRYDSHPEITEKWLESEKLYREGKGPRVMHADIGAEGTALEKEEVRKLVDVFESYGIEVIPEIQSLSHIEYITNAHPEFAELGKYFTEKQNEKTKDQNSGDYVPEIPDANAAGIHHANILDHCYCPSEEACMNIIYDIIDEIVEVVKPKRYVHIGHDEVYHIGLCPECKKKGAPRVYIEHVKALYDYLKKKGLGTMLWSDMFHTDMYYTGGDYSIVKEELPKDLVLLDFTWYYHFDKDIEDELLPAGYKSIMMGNLYSSHYPRFASRISKDGMIGGEVSTWTAVSEEKFGENGKFFDLPYTAEMLWNAYTYDENNRASLTALIGQCIIPEMRDLMHGRYDLYLATDIHKADYASFPGESKRIPRELGYLGLIEPTDKIKVGKKYDRLVFEHATINTAPRICWQELVPVGKYTVVYNDGNKVDIPVNYAGGILAASSTFGLPMPQQYYRHQGYIGTWFADPTYEYRTAEGEPILLLGQIWDNPHPEKKITCITYTPDEKDYAILVSGGVLGIKLN